MQILLLNTSPVVGLYIIRPPHASQSIFRVSIAYGVSRHVTVLAWVIVPRLMAKLPAFD